MENKAQSTPLVTVLLPVFNAATTLERTLNSIVNQTYKNLEIIAINDGSTDNSLEILEKYQSEDARVKVVSRENKGLIRTLNEGLDYANGDYIVREDSDDYSEINRVQLQVEFMQKNQNIAVAGSYSRSFGHSNRLTKYPTDKELCKAIMLFYPCVAHPSVIIRKSFLDINNIAYPTEYKHCEDYALWTRIIDSGGEIANIPVVLHHYNNHDEQVSVKNHAESSENHYRLVSERLHALGVFVEKDTLLHLVYANKAHMKDLTPSLFKTVVQTYVEIHAKTESNGYSRQAMQQTLHKMISEPIINKMGLAGFVIYQNNKASLATPFDLKLPLKALLRTIKNTLKAIVKN
jgi:glycosyltransferase involved in cell wall biosynthesis